MTFAVVAVQCGVAGLSSGDGDRMALLARVISPVRVFRRIQPIAPPPPPVSAPATPG